MELAIGRAFQHQFFRGTVTLEFFRKDLLSEMCGGVPCYVYCVPVMLDESKTPGHQKTRPEKHR